MRLRRPRSECAKTTTKYSCFIVSPGRTLFWIRADEKRGGPVGLFHCSTTIGEPQTVTGITQPCQPVIVGCKSLIHLVLSLIYVALRLPGTLFLRNLVERRSLLFQL